MVEKYKPKYPYYGQPGEPFGYAFTYEDIVGDAHMTKNEWQCIKELAKDKSYLEIGSYRGYSTSAAKLGGATYICCIDYQPKPIPAKIANRYIIADSLEAFAQLDHELFDLILIDANHTEKYLAADLAHYYPHLKPEGLIMCHDYGVEGTYLGVWGVAEAVDKFFQPSQYVKTVDSLIVFRKEG